MNALKVFDVVERPRLAPQRCGEFDGLHVSIQKFVDELGQEPNRRWPGWVAGHESIIGTPTRHRKR
jgi:hypothetical protein